jgi:hypothetical protein
VSEKETTLKYKNNDLASFTIDPINPEIGWKLLQDRCPSLTDWGIRFLRSGLDGFVQTIVLEPYYTCKDHRNLHSNFYSKKFSEVTSICQRLHFLNVATADPKDLLANPQNYQKGYLGFSVIRPVNRRCIGRTVIDPYKIGKPIKEGYYLLRTPFSAQINGTHFAVEGYPFTTQDLDATLCAHSALWGVCRYLSERYTHYKELFPFDFIKMTETSQGRVFPYRGMTYTDYCKILTEFGTYPVFAAVQRKEGDKIVQDSDAFTDLCAYVESGFPVLASVRLSTANHVVSLIGHTINYDKPIAVTTGFVDSSHFLKQFIVVDDNAFPYQLLGEGDDPVNYAPSFYGASPVTNQGVGLKDIITMTCPLPEKVFLTAKRAREKALKHLEFFKSTLLQAGPEPFVTRLFVTSSSAFKKRKLMIAKAEKDMASSVPVGLHLPHFLWVMEVYSLDEYKKGICLAEIVLDSTAGSADDGIIYIRVGNKLYVAAADTIWKTVPGPTRFPQYTHNLGEHEVDPT